jgi:putative FmdB family regulatory protein
MPFYDYRCERCDAVVELLHGIDEVPTLVHEGCGGSLEKQFAATSIHFKGSGWAKLDRRAPAGGEGTAAPAAAPAAPAAAPTPPSTKSGAGE